MKAEKVTVTIKMEALSIDVLSGMLSKVVDCVNHETISGMLRMDDGDQIEWKTVKTPVEF